MGYHTTRWTVVLAAREGNGDRARVIAGEEPMQFF